MDRVRGNMRGPRVHGDLGTDIEGEMEAEPDFPAVVKIPCFNVCWPGTGTTST